MKAIGAILATFAVLLLGACTPPAPVINLESTSFVHRMAMGRPGEPEAPLRRIGVNTNWNRLRRR